MVFASVFALVVGVSMIGQWLLFLLTGQVPELETEPLRIRFHLAAEFVTAIHRPAGQRLRPADPSSLGPLVLPAGGGHAALHAHRQPRLLRPEGPVGFCRHVRRDLDAGSGQSCSCHLIGSNSPGANRYKIGHLANPKSPTWPMPTRHLRGILEALSSPLGPGGRTGNRTPTCSPCLNTAKGERG